MHIELLSASATAAAAAGSAAAAVAGDSLVVKNGRGRIALVALWAHLQSSGFIQLSTPTAHDTTRGYRTDVPAAELDQRLPIGIDFEVQAQETLSVTIAEAAVVGDVGIVSALVHYADLPGMAQRLITWSQFQSRLDKLTSLAVTITGAAAGYTGAELITAESDLLRANRDYALLGMSTDVECAALTVIGPDTGNVRLGVPGVSDDSNYGQSFFGLISRAHDMPAIPVINSGNKASTLVGILQNENNVSPRVTLLLGLMK